MCTLWSNYDRFAVAAPVACAPVDAVVGNPACAALGAAPRQLLQQRQAVAICTDFATQERNRANAPLRQLIRIGDERGCINPLPADLEGARAAVGNDV
jgi:hypothetical protein